MPNPQTQMFGANIRLLIGLLVFLALVLAAIVAAWTGIKIGLWRARRWRAGQDYYAERHGADGRHLPPTSRGFCDRCGGAFDRVLHLESGERTCMTCYRNAPATGRTKLSGSRQ